MTGQPLTPERRVLGAYLCDLRLLADSPLDVHHFRVPEDRQLLRALRHVFHDDDTTTPWHVAQTLRETEFTEGELSEKEYLTLEIDLYALFDETRQNPLEVNELSYFETTMLLRAPKPDELDEEQEEVEQEAEAGDEGEAVELSDFDRERQQERRLLGAYLVDVELLRDTPLTLHHFFHEVDSVLFEAMIIFMASGYGATPYEINDFVVDVILEHKEPWLREKGRGVLDYLLDLERETQQNPVGEAERLELEQAVLAAARHRAGYLPGTVAPDDTDWETPCSRHAKA